MKSLLLLTVICAVSVFTSSAQRIRFTDTANRWRVESSQGNVGEACQEVALLKMGTDTIIRGVSYKKLQTLSHSYGCQVPYYPYGVTHYSGGDASAKITGGYYREDTILQRVYCLPFQPNDTAERIIYDSKWQIGDSVSWGIMNNGPYGKNVVTAIDSVLLFGYWHRVFHFDYTGYGFIGRGYDIVEGLGCTDGIAYAVNPIKPFENDDELRCYSRAGVQPPFALASGWPHRFDNDNTCTVYVLGISQEPGTEIADIKIVPNPGTTGMQMQLPITIKAGRVTVTDIAGKTVASFKFSEKSKLPIGQLLHTAGIYYYMLQDTGTGNRYTGHLLFTP